MKERLPPPARRRSGRLCRAGRGVLVTAAVVPLVAAALEPRYDHRDTHGPAVELLLAHDTVARPGAPTVSTWRPAVRLGWGFDPLGVGDELSFGADVALRSFGDAERAEHVLLGLDARYRGYFGADELKTFFDVGVWVPIRSRLAVGPLAGLGVQYDISSYTGVYLAGSFATAFGRARIASVGVSAGVQLRFDLP